MFSTTDQIIDTASPGRAQAIAEAGAVRIPFHCYKCGHDWQSAVSGDCPECLPGRHSVSLTTEQLQKITGILSNRMALCDERMAKYSSEDGLAYWQAEKAEAEAMRELLRGAL